MEAKRFIDRHIGPDQEDIRTMLHVVGVDSVDELISETIPAEILKPGTTGLNEGMSEYDYYKHIRELASLNKMYKSYIGLGYYGTVMPGVIQRNILENPAWYTSYTPYQAEISQGRLEALFNFQTVICELTGMEIANASLLDEATAAAEAMIMLFHARSKDKKDANRFFMDKNTFPQVIDVVKTRGEALGIDVDVGDYQSFKPEASFFGVYVQYPNALGSVEDYTRFSELINDAGLFLTVGADILGLALLKPPAQWNADVVVGSTQRMGIPMGFGGPHAAYFVTKDVFKRHIPGRIIGETIDVSGKKAFRMAIQTREQHIKRERATSNICTAQALLATMAGMYALYHGHEGLCIITRRIHALAASLESSLRELGCQQLNKQYFDTLHIQLPSGISSSQVERIALEQEINFYYVGKDTVMISIDETTSREDIDDIIKVFCVVLNKKLIKTKPKEGGVLQDQLCRKDTFFQQAIFSAYRSESEMMRYMKRLERKDYALTDGMIPLGSCTMKLNAASEMIPLSWPDFGNIHPLVPLEQAEGYYDMINRLGKFLQKITGLSAVSFQPNSGAAGEYTGLLVIRKYLQNKGEDHRDVVLIPASAHGTNPASAVMAGMKVETVACDTMGNVNITSLQEKIDQNKGKVAAFMVTYPSTHGVFEEKIEKMVQMIHDEGGQVYMDGANMNAQMGLTSPAIIGADVCHLNLHKTFAIPHGGGGPGMGPIAVAEHLVEFLPTHPLAPTGGLNGTGAVAAAPYGSASILSISYAYIMMAGGDGLKKSAEIAILNANYLASLLKDYYPVLYTNKNGRVAHEMIIDLRSLKGESGITEADVAKRLMDYGFHAPTLSFPVYGTLMVEPTESESLQELNRFAEAMIAIYEEIKKVKEGVFDKNNNPLKNAPHTLQQVTANDWEYFYTREQAAYPVEILRERKFWASVARVNDAYGDRNLVCCYRRE